MKKLLLLSVLFSGFLTERVLGQDALVPTPMELTRKRIEAAKNLTESVQKQTIATDVQKHMSPENIAQFTEALRTQSVTLSPDFLKRAQALKADMFAFGAAEVRKMIEQIKDPATKTSYMTIANLMNQLASAIRALPVPREAIRKTFEDVSQLMALKARKKALKAEMFRTLAEQSGNKMFSEKADFMTKYAAALDQGTKSEAQPSRPTAPLGILRSR